MHHFITRRRLLANALLIMMVLPFWAQGQDADKPKPQAWLGVLTLQPHYKQDSNWKSADEAAVGQHFTRLKAFTQQGKVVLAGRTTLANDHADMMGLVIFYAATPAEADAFMQDDPAVKAGIMQAKVLPYSIALLGKGT